MALARTQARLSAGQLDRRITFQVAVEVRDSFGEPVQTWANLASHATVPARVEPLRGSERFAAQQVNADTDTKFTIRYRNDLTEKMRILYEARYYDVHSIHEVGRHQWLEIEASLQEQP